MIAPDKLLYWSVSRCIGLCPAEQDSSALLQVKPHVGLGLLNEVSSALLQLESPVRHLKSQAFEMFLMADVPFHMRTCDTNNHVAAITPCRRFFPSL